MPFYSKKVGLLDLIDKGLKFPEDTETKKISQETKELIKRMLVKDTSQRIQWDELFRHPLLKSKYSSTGKYILYETMVQYPKIADLVQDENCSEITLGQKDVLQLQESEKNYQKK